MDQPILQLGALLMLTDLAGSRLKFRIPSRARVDFIRFTIRVALPHQAVALAVRPLGVLFGNRGHPRHASTRRKPARQPKAVAAGFEGKRNPRDRAAGPDRLILPAMQQGK